MTNTLSLPPMYPFQETAIEQARQNILNQHRAQVIYGPTGSGKTVMIAHMVESAMQKGGRCLFLVDRLVLVKQTSENFWGFGIPNGVMQGSNSIGKNQQVLVCSQQTLEKVDFDRWPHATLIIVDECHTQRKKITEYIRSTNATVIGLSATPFAEGMANTYSTVVNEFTTDFLLSEINPATGRPYLAPMKVYASTEIDMTGASVVGGEWTAKAVRERGATVIGNVVTEYIDKCYKHFGQPVKTLMFTADIAQGADLCAAFQAAGLDFRQSTYKDSTETTQAMIKDFGEGKFLGLVSVDKFTKGFDDPSILCIILARPYHKSFASFIQALGRGLRSSEGKEFVLVLDFSGNVAGYYADMVELFAEGCDTLNDEKRKDIKRKEGKERGDITCAACGYIMGPEMAMCPACGATKPRRKTRAKHVDGYMESVDVHGSKKVPDWAKDKPWVWEEISTIAATRYPDSNEQARKYALAQYRDLYGEWPKSNFDAETARAGDGTHDERVAKKLAQQTVAYWKRNSRRK